MARADRRRPVRDEGRWSWWWLALPALGIAGYAAFAATLALLGGDGAPPPSGAVRDAEQRLPMTAPASSLAPPAAPVDVVAPAPLAPSESAPAEVAPAAAASIVPAPTATAAAQRAAADAARKVKPKRAPQEHLTEQDRRALDALVEQAGKKPR